MSNSPLWGLSTLCRSFLRYVELLHKAVKPCTQWATKGSCSYCSECCAPVHEQYLHVYTHTHRQYAPPAPSAFANWKVCKSATTFFVGRRWRPCMCGACVLITMNSSCIWMMHMLPSAASSAPLLLPHPHPATLMMTITSAITWMAMWGCHMAAGLRQARLHCCISCSCKPAVTHSCCWAAL